MTMTNAQRQSRYRFRQSTQGAFGSEGTPMTRLNVWVSQIAAHGLRVLAKQRGHTIQETLDHVLRDAVDSARQKTGKHAWAELSMTVLDDEPIS